jgi:YfiH family protein
MIQAKNLGAVTGIRHGFFGRAGGVSEGIYASLNCGFGSGDDSERVAENRARVMRRSDLDPANLVTAWQTHSTRVAVVDQVWARGEAPQVDAMVTTTPGIGLGVLHADCAPILFVDGTARVAGAAHAGWRGAIEGVLEATLTEMQRQGAALSRIAAAIGPCIGQLSYEVGPEFRERFIAGERGNAKFFAASAARPTHFHFDLEGYCAHRLARAGLAQIERLGRDTCALSDDFFSYRRRTLEGGKDYGRNISLIALED